MRDCLQRDGRGGYDGVVRRGSDGRRVTVGSVALVIYAWVEGRGPLLALLALTAVMLPVVGFAVLLVSRGWLGVLL